MVIIDMACLFLLRVAGRLRWNIQPQLRSCLSTTPVTAGLYKTVPEQPVPVEGIVKGTIPSWLNGKLVRNGPGLFEIGGMKYNHWFDGMALLHSFTIKSGKVTYMSKFLQSDTYKRNKAANRIVVTEFGTIGVPDPCQTLFQRVKSYYTSLIDPSQGVTDNCIVNVYPAGDKYIAATETDFVHVFSPETLESEERIQLTKHFNVAVNFATAHPHYEPDGTVYNLGNSTAGYTLLKIPPAAKGHHVMEKAKVLCSVPPKYRFRPGYSHSFGATENYLVFLEQPFQIDVLKILRNKVLNKEIMATNMFMWDDNEQIRFHVIEKNSGRVLPTRFMAPKSMIFHHINAFEDKGHIVLDACAYRDGSVYSILGLEDLNDSTSEYYNADSVRVEPRRYVLPIDSRQQSTKAENLVTLDYTTSTAKLQDDGTILCEHEPISKKGFELPRINYEMCNGKPYQFAYGLNQKFTEIIKVDIKTKDNLVWDEDGCTVSEPVFAGKPGSKQEDEGVILSAVLHDDEIKPPFLLVLDAVSMTEMGRVEFPGIQFHRDIHGMYIPSDQI